MKAYQPKQTPTPLNKPILLNNPTLAQIQPTSNLQQYLGDYQPLNKLLLAGKPTSTTSVTSTSQLANVISSIPVQQSSYVSYNNFESSNGNNNVSKFNNSKVQSMETPIDDQLVGANILRRINTNANRQTSGNIASTSNSPNPRQSEQIKNNNNSIRDMKKKLDELLKQTEQLTQKKQRSLNKDVQRRYIQSNKNGNSNSSQKYKYSYSNSKSRNNLSINLDRSIQMLKDKQNKDSQNLKNNLNNLNNHNYTNSDISSATRTQQPQSFHNFGNKYKKQSINQNQNQNNGLYQSNNASDKSLLSNNSKSDVKINSNIQASPSNFKDFPVFKLNNQKHNRNSDKQMNINLNNISEQFNFNDSKKANTERASTKLEQKQYRKQYNQQNSFMKRPTSSFQYNLTDNSNYVQKTNSLNNNPSIKPTQIPQSLKQCQLKLISSEQQIKKLKQQLSDMTDGKQYYRKQLSQSWRSNKQLKDQYQQKIADINKSHKQQINKFEQQLRNKQQENGEKIFDIKQVHIQQISKFQDIIKQKQLQKIVQIQAIRKAHAQEILKLEEIIKKKDQNLVKLVRQISQSKVNVGYEEKAKKVIQSNQQLVNKLTNKQKQISQLKAQLIQKDSSIEGLTQKINLYQDQLKQLNAFKNEKIQSNTQNFDQILKGQLKSIAQFKQMTERLNQKNNQLRQKLSQSNRRNQFLANQTKIAELKFKSSLNSSIMQSAIELTNKQNLISSLNKKISTIQQKYRSAMTQIRSKDQFFKHHLLGRADSNTDFKEYVQGVLTNYRQHFAQSKQDQLKSQLEKALKKIQLYEKYA